MRIIIGPNMQTIVKDLNLFDANGTAIFANVTATYGVGENLVNLSPEQPGTAQRNKWFLQCLNGLILRTEPRMNVLGEVRVGDYDNIYAPDVKINEVICRSPMLFAKPFLVPGTVYDNIILGIKSRDIVLSELEIFRRVQTLLNAHNLWLRYYSLFNYNVHDISKKEQETICVLRALLLEPYMILADYNLFASQNTELQKILEYSMDKYIFICAAV